MLSGVPHDRKVDVFSLGVVVAEVFATVAQAFAFEAVGIALTAPACHDCLQAVSITALTY